MVIYIVSYHIVHLINLDCVGYLPSHDISHFIWDSDILGSMVGDDISYHNVHLINLDGVGYLPSHDISHFIWDSDILGSMVGDDISYHIVSYRTHDQPGWCGLPPFPWHLSLHLGLRYTRLHGRWWYIVSYRIISYTWSTWMVWVTSLPMTSLTSSGTLIY